MKAKRGWRRALAYAVLVLFSSGATATGALAQLAYVTSQSDDSVSVIDTISNAVTATIPVGDLPLGIASTPSGRRLYVATLNAQAVDVIDTASNAVIATIGACTAPLGCNPGYVAVSPDGTRAWVTMGASNEVWVIDTATQTVITKIPVTGTQPHEVAFTPDGLF